MKINNIIAIIRHDLTVIRRVRWRLLEITYFPIVTIILWGLYAQYSKTYAPEAGMIVLIVNMFWSFSQLSQQQANMLIMEDVWSLNIKHILVSGISEYEYVIAKLLTSTTIAVTIGTILLFIANAFGAPLFTNLHTVILIAVIALLGSIALAIFVAGTIIMVGREYGFLSWSVLQLFIFLSAPFFSPQMFPSFMRWITEIMPFTYVFQTARAIATNTPVQSSLIIHAAIVVLVYMILSLPYYRYAFRRTRKTGMLARITH
jgi:ABC-2 type transport system permease protein